MPRLQSPARGHLQALLRIDGKPCARVASVTPSGLRAALPNDRLGRQGCVGAGLESVAAQVPWLVAFALTVNAAGPGAAVLTILGLSAISVAAIGVGMVADC